MKLSYLPSEFQKALPILEKIKAHGFEAYFVGGQSAMPFSTVLFTMLTLLRLLILRRPNRFLSVR